MAFVQRPGKTLFDTRVELGVDPGRFLSDVLAVWSPTGDLGHVAAAQFVGYLFPMGSWFAAADAVGLPPWIAQRLWIGALIALAGLGAMKVVDELFRRERGAAHLVAAATYAVNPYVLVQVNRATVTLLAYAALPWLLVAAHRGLHAGRSWRWALAVAVLVTLAGGGVNAAVLAWVLAAPAALVLYEVVVLRAGLRTALAFGVRAGVLTLALSLWWIVPVLLQGRYGADFISFTEQPATILATNSLAESLRLLGYWPVYVEIGQGVNQALSTWVDTALSWPVVAAGFALPLVAFGGLAWSWRWRFAPFFALLGAGAVTLMALGFPDGTPMRAFITDVYYDVEGLQFLRTPYKAGPLAALSLAVLAGVAADPVVRLVRERRLRLFGHRVPRVVLWVLAVAPFIAAWPLVTGRALNESQAYGDVPEHWQRAVEDAERASAPGRRTMVLPGTLFGDYRWGHTASAIAPALTDRKVLVREMPRYAPPRSSQLLASVDDRVQQGRLVPGQLPPLLALLGVDQVLTGTDDALQTGALDPARTTELLQGEGGLDEPVARYGAERFATPEAGRDGSLVRVPAVRRYATGPAPGAVRLQPRAGATVLDGDAEGVAELAAHGQLDPGRALFYAGDVGRERLAGLVADGATLVVTDSARRRAAEGVRTTENQGPTLGPDEPLPREWPAYELFPELGSDAQTVAVHTGGVRAVRSPLDRGYAVFPERRPYAALDGRTDTSWIASTFSAASRRWMEVEFERPRVLRSIGVLPHDDRVGRTRQVAVSFDGGEEQVVDLAPGWNELRLRAEPVRRLRLRIAATDADPFGGPGGIAELRLSPTPVRERLRLPLTLARRARGLDLSRAGMTVLLQRTTADFPRRAGAEVESAQSTRPLDMVDAEPGLERELELPEARSFAIDGWASVDPRAPDAALDRLVGGASAWQLSSSSRFGGLAGNRASSAFDGDRSTAWVGDWLSGRSSWLEWRSPEPTRVRSLRLLPGAAQHTTPSQVVVETPRGRTRPLGVTPAGRVRLPRPVLARRVRVRITEVRGARAPDRLLRAVAVSEVVVPGLRPPAPRRTGALRSGCGPLRVSAAGGTVPMVVTGTVQDFDDGRPLRLSGCGSRPRLELPAGRSELVAAPSQLLRPDHLRLDAPAPVPVPDPPAAGVVGQGRWGNGVHEDVTLAPGGPSWLVLAESHSPGWRAWCRGPDGDERALGAPVPIDAFANGWPVDERCRQARFAFAPQGTANAAYAVSAVTGLGAALLAALSALRRRRRGGTSRLVRLDDARSEGLGDVDTPVLRLPPAQALVAGLLLGLLAAGLFALRAGPLVAAIATVALLAGATPRRLGLLAGAAIAAMPPLYLVNPLIDFGTSSFTFPLHHMLPHWLGVVVVCSVVAAGLLAARAHRRPAARAVKDSVPSSAAVAAEPEERLATAGSSAW